MEIDSTIEEAARRNILVVHIDKIEQIAYLLLVTMTRVATSEGDLFQRSTLA